MGDERPRESWKTAGPLPLYKHSLFCTKGTACLTPGCMEYKSCQTHTNNCRNPRCPIPPCIARRQLTDANFMQYESVVYQCALWATDLVPLVPSSSPAASSSSNSSNNQSTSQFRIPNMRPPKKRPKMANKNEQSKKSDPPPKL